MGAASGKSETAGDGWDTSSFRLSSTVPVLGLRPSLDRGLREGTASGRRVSFGVAKRETEEEEGREAALGAAAGEGSRRAEGAATTAEEEEDGGGRLEGR